MSATDRDLLRDLGLLLEAVGQAVDLAAWCVDLEPPPLDERASGGSIRLVRAADSLTIDFPLSPSWRTLSAGTIVRGTAARIRRELGEEASP